MNDSLKSIVAELLEIDAGQLLPERVLAGGRLQGSLGRSILDAAMRRRLSIQSPACYTAKTFGDLQSAVDGKSITNGSAAIPAAATASNPTGENAVSTGIDIELIESLPVTTDFWSHEFYTTHFTPAEIAYCLTQQNPRPHFTARWCAKEATRKCVPQLLAEEMRNIEVASAPNGKPLLRHHQGSSVRDLPVAVSLSHSDRSAIAVVINVPAAKPVVFPVTSFNHSSGKFSDKLIVCMLFCSLAAIALAVAAIVISLRH